MSKILKDKSHLTSLSLCRILVRMISNGLLEIVAPEAKGQAMESSGANKAKKYQSTEPITGKYIKNYRGESRQNIPLEWASYYARLNEIAHQLTAKHYGKKN
ncbi:MAG: hypothetical protein QMD66_00185 [Actinomycetota bacterium]|nr:hypothetical protein [Actinomycetota bacterium]